MIRQIKEWLYPINHGGLLRRNYYVPAMLLPGESWWPTSTVPHQLITEYRKKRNANRQ